MRRRSGAGGEPTKAQRRKTAARESGVAPKAVRPRSSFVAGQQTKLVRFNSELNEGYGDGRSVAGHEPLDTQSAGRARHPWRNGPTTVPRGQREHLSSEGRVVRFLCEFSTRAAALCKH